MSSFRIKTFFVYSKVFLSLVVLRSFKDVIIKAYVFKRTLHQVIDYFLSYDLVAPKGAVCLVRQGL